MQIKKMLLYLHQKNKQNRINMRQNTTENVIVQRNDNISRFLTDIRQYDVLSVDEQIELLIKYKETGDIKYRDAIVVSNLRLLYKEAKSYTKDPDVILDIVNEGVKGLVEAAERFDETRGFSYITFARHWIHKFMTEYVNNKGGVIRNEFVRRCGHKIKKVQENFYAINHRYPEHHELTEIMNEKYGIDIEKYSGLYNFTYLHISDYATPNDSSSETFEESGVFAEMTCSNNEYNNDIDNDYNKYIINKALAVLKDRDADIVKMFFGVGEYTTAYSKQDIAEKHKMTVQRIEQIVAKSLGKMKTRIKRVA